MATIQWGDVGTWVGGLGTMLAFLLALILFRAQGAQQEQGREDARRELARHVWALVVNAEETESVPQSELGPTEFSNPRTWHLHVKVSNQGDEPVWSTVVGVRSLTINPFGAYEWSVNRCYVGIIAPKLDVEADLTMVEPFSPTILPNPATFPPLEVTFQDATGRCWTRQDNGRLVDLGTGALGILPTAFIGDGPTSAGPVSQNPYLTKQSRRARKSRRKPGDATRPVS